MNEMPSAVRDAKRNNAKRSTARARGRCTTHKRSTTVRKLHDVGTVFTALCVVHSRAVSSRVGVPVYTACRCLVCCVVHGFFCGAHSPTGFLVCGLLCCTVLARWHGSVPPSVLLVMADLVLDETWVTGTLFFLDGRRRCDAEDH